MRILIADAGETMRGGQWQTLYLAQGLLAAGGDVRVLALRKSPFFEQARAAEIDPEPLTAFRFRRAARWADVVHVQDARSHTLAALFCQKPVVVSRRVAFPVRGGPFSAWKYRRAAGYIAVSQHVADVLRKSGIPDEAITVVHDGVPRPPGPLRAYDERTIPFLSLRTNDPAKGDDLLLRAARLAGIDVHWSTDLATDLAQTRVFVYLTRSEGLGSAVLLAMANGAAVVASRTGGLKDSVEHEVSGLLTENEPAQIAVALRRMLDYPRFAAQLAAAARERVLDRFSMERMVRETISVYQKVVR